MVMVKADCKSDVGFLHATNKNNVIIFVNIIMPVSFKVSFYVPTSLKTKYSNTAENKIF